MVAFVSPGGREFCVAEGIDSVERPRGLVGTVLRRWTIAGIDFVDGCFYRGAFFIEDTAVDGTLRARGDDMDSFSGFLWQFRAG